MPTIGKREQGKFWKYMALGLIIGSFIPDQYSPLAIISYFKNRN